MSSNTIPFPKTNDLFSNLYQDWDYEDPQSDIVGYDAGYPIDYGAPRLNPAVMIVVLAVLVGIILVAAASSIEYSTSSAQTGETAVIQTANQPTTNETSYRADAITFTVPYPEYAITQGIHGQSYGHMAIDIAAGRGEPILSPINGVVTQLYMDEYGNPTIVIENDVYQVMFLHGDYSVALGDTLKAGQVFGTESNKGYTMDMAGNLCYNREWCGNHSHLNVYDKRIQANINPLDLIGG